MNWSLTLLGSIAAILVPMPVIFLVFGSRIRARSKFAPGFDLKLAAKRRQDEENRSGSEGEEKRADAVDSSS